MPSKKRRKKTSPKTSSAKKSVKKKALVKHKKKKKKRVKKSIKKDTDVVLSEEEKIQDDHDFVTKELKGSESGSAIEFIDDEDDSTEVTELVSDFKKDKKIETLETIEIEKEIKPEKKLKKKKVKKNKKAKKVDLKNQLTEIYENGDGSMPNMKTFEKRPNNKLLRAFFILLFAAAFFAIVAWVGLFIIQPQTEFSEDEVILSISGDEEVKAGQEVTYRVRYRNSQNIMLEGVVLEVRYPKGFQFSTSSIPADNELHDLWKLGTLDPQDGGYIDITGKLFGDIEEKQSVRVFLNYTPANFSSPFQKVSHISITTNESILQVSIDMPEEIAIGSEVPITIVLEPEEMVSYITISCDTDIFKPKEKSEPALDEGADCAWSFDELEKKQEITFSGSFVEHVDDIALMNIMVHGWEDEKRNGDGYILATEKKEAVLKKESTIFHLAVNGGLNSLNVEPGESLNTSILLKNTGEQVLEDVEVQMIWDAPSYLNRSILSWSDIDMEHDADVIGEQKSETVRRGVISWNKDDIAELAQIMPGEEIHIDFSLPIKDDAQTTLSDFIEKNIVGVAELHYGVGDEDDVLTSNEIILTLVSDIDLEVRDDIGENVEGNPVHTVTWLLSNSFHELKDITVEAEIYGEVVLTADDFVVPAGELSYDVDAQKMIWTIDSMPLGIDVLAAQFDITLVHDNPSQSQLMSKSVLQAIDTVLDESISGVGDAILLPIEVN